MNKTLSILFLNLLFADVSYAQDGGNSTIKGVVESVDTDKKEAKIRTADQDYIIKIYDTVAKTQELLTSPKSKQTISSFEIPNKAIVSKSAAPMRADCSELPISLNELEAVSNESTDMVDFLKKIPKGTLQGFTFVTNSLSLHRGKKDANGEGQVSPMWPRVLRSSADGKLTISFVCDPKNPTFGKVEIMSFDDASNEFKFTEFDFGHPADPKKILPKDRIHHNPESCVSCHAGSKIGDQVTLKPNWPEYFMWTDCKDNRGIQMYGGNDDNMGKGQFRARSSVSKGPDLSGCNYSTDKKKSNEEKKQFLQFRELQKDNVCFNSLPWDNARNMGKDEEFYPYSKRSQRKESGGRWNYARRTNLRFTDTYGHLMAKRNFGIISKSDDYEKVKYFLAMEEAGCFTPKDEELLKQILPELVLEKTVVYGNTNQNYQIELQAPLLYNYSKSIGLNNKDWTMEFREENDPNYNSAIPFDGSGDANIFNVTAGNVLSDIGEKNSAMKALAESSKTRGVERFFGEKFSCIDDTGTAVARSAKGASRPLCQKLHEENEKHLAKIIAAEKDCEDCKKKKPASVTSELNAEVDIINTKITEAQIAKGKELVEAEGKGKCVTCHSTGADVLPAEYQFVPSEKDPKKAQSHAILRSKPDTFGKTLEERLITKKNMPPGDLGADLTLEDREAIRAYILSVMKAE